MVLRIQDGTRSIHPDTYFLGELLFLPGDSSRPALRSLALQAKWVTGCLTEK